MPKGKPAMPAWLKGRGAELWDEILGFAYWLTIADSYKLASWCDRQAEYEKPTKRKKWTAADRREHRSAGTELWLDITTLTRMGGLKSGDDEKKDPAAKYLA